MNVMPLDEAPKYKIVGTAAYDFGDICATGMPIYLKDNNFYEGYFGLSTVEQFRPRPNPYVAKKGNPNLLLLAQPAVISKPVAIESFCILQPLEKELLSLGIEEPFNLDYLAAKELIDTNGGKIILRFGEMGEIADKLLSYSELLQQKAIEQMRNRQSIEIESLKRESFHTLLDASFSFHVNSHPSTSVGKKKKNELMINSRILDVANAKINGDEEGILMLKTLFNPEEYGFASSWRELEKIVDEKIKELKL
jgi:hypothetical protein